MITAKKISGFALATATAAIFLTVPMAVSAGEGDAKGHCSGVNACKGHGACKTADNACAGQNACKGTGFVAVDEKTCEDLGGEFEG